MNHAYSVKLGREDHGSKGEWVWRGEVGVLWWGAGSAQQVIETASCEVPTLC